jgi:serralysin
MPSIATYSTTGNAYIDGVLGNYKWGVGSFTYSFPAIGSYYGSSYGSGENTTRFGAFNTAQQAATREALKMFASVANLSFTEIIETSTQHADLRFAMSDKPNTAWAYLPSTAAEGGDAWFNNSSGSYKSPAKANYAYFTIMHETGHSLGLEHAHEHFVMPSSRDSLEYTVMSYRSYVGASTTTGYTNETWGYTQSLMMYDIAALQHMYGANFSTYSGNTTYSWSPTTGEMFISGVGQGTPGGNKILQTVWDGGGVDTYSFSNYKTNLKIDLRPGNWTTTSTSQLAKLHYDGSKIAVGNIANALLYNGDTRSLIENAIGGSGNDTITGNNASNSLNGGAGNDRLTGGRGNDILNGGSGTDTAAFSGARSNYSVSMLSDGSLQVVDLRSGTPDGKDLVRSVERFQFSDKIYSVAELTTASSAAISKTSLVGSTTDDHLTGGDGNDKLYGNAGNDSLYGLGGNDVLLGGAGNDYLDGGAGNDTASYSAAIVGLVADLLNSASNTGEAYGDTYVSIESLTGSAYADTLRGDAAANVLNGGAGADHLYGRGGNDTLFGVAGNDVLIGGAGDDTFLFQPVAGGFGKDTITDFWPGAGSNDQLAFSSALFSSREQALAASWQVGEDVWVAHSSNNIVVLAKTQLHHLTVDDFRIV